MTQYRQNLRPKLKNQRSTKRSRARVNGLGWTDPTTGYPWGPPQPVMGGARPCVLGGMAVRLVLPRAFLAFFHDFSFSVSFCCCLPLKLQCIWTFWESQSTPYTPFHLLRVSSFREKEGEVKSARILDQVRGSRD